MELSVSGFLNSIGLFLDILGALLIFFNSPEKTHVTLIHSDEETNRLERKAKRQVNYTKIGALILTFGFVLQLISNWT